MVFYLFIFTPSFQTSDFLRTRSPKTSSFYDSSIKCEFFIQIIGSCGVANSVIAHNAYIPLCDELKKDTPRAGQTLLRRLGVIYL